MQIMRLAGVIFAALVFSGSPPPVHAYDFQSCDGCHERSLDRDKFRFYLHSPFSQQQCGECHAPVAPLPTPNAKAGALAVNRKTIIWLGESIMADTEHGFVLPGDKVGNTLVVEAQGVDGSLSLEEIAVPALTGLPAAEDTGQPPVISEVQVLKVQRGVFLSTTIGWETDTLADAVVRYGTGDGDLGQASAPSKRFGRRHEVVLYELQPSRTYRFKVVSQDLSGRARESGIQTFSTSQAVTKTLPAPAPPSQGQAGAVGRFYREGKDYLLELILPQPAAVSVGWRGGARNPEVVKETVVAPAGAAEPHAGLSAKDIVTMGACRSCHRDQNTATHPVNVYPKPGMTIPPEYPTLPDGRITCHSCHDPHSSENESLARKPGKRELCVGCHVDML